MKRMLSLSSHSWGL